MPSIIRATTTNGLQVAPDNSGSLQLQTNGTTAAVTIDTSQNVGIGTTSPDTKLQISGTSGSVQFRAGTDTNGFFEINAFDSNPIYCVVGGSNATAGVFGTQSNIPTILYTNNTERMRIDSSGNVGIGTNTSAGNALRYLDVQNFDTGSSAGAITRLITSNVAGSGTTSVDLVKYKAGQFAINNNETNSAAFTSFTVGASERMRIDSSGALILAGSTAQKATGTTWSNPSDQRLKDNIRDYTKGTNELMQVRVREWEYNGKGNTTEGMKGLGVVADEVMTVLPDTVETYDAKLNADDEETTAIKKFDATEITWLLVKTVQEQQTIINDLKARIETLEAK